MGQQLTVHNAEVHTATVEVRTLTISGKQVTLAVFRQLPEEPLLSADWQLVRGLPWGVVNYHPGPCGDARKYPRHIHVVWQRGSELRRARIDAPPHPDCWDDPPEEAIERWEIWRRLLALPQLFIAV